jgi:hypothetical protein
MGLVEDMSIENTSNVGNEPKQELKKPPLGLTPKWIRRKEFDQNRANEILEAIQRYRQADIYIPVEWVDELKELICNE